jgi:teichuronic acid biosynthesis glycosyltransferase TuaH
MKVLYLSHIDWGWIKQRPQFVAEYLSENGVDCQVYYQKSLNPRTISEFQSSGYDAKPFWKIPLKNRNRFLMSVNNGLQRLMCRRLIRKLRPDVIWVTHPEFLGILPKKSNVPVVYDCMDDIVGFYDPQSWIAQHFAHAETELLKLARHAFFSSDHLTTTVLARAKVSTQHSLIRNAYHPRKGNFAPVVPAVIDNNSDRTPAKLAYFGTIASWLDIETLAHVCRAHPQLEIDLYGPAESKHLITDLPPGISYKGISPHSELRSIAARYDALIMPFVVNDLIQSVDPVKLYEYIDFDKPIISVFYEEIERFSQFVNFYTSPQEFVQLIMTSCAGLKKYTATERATFLANNTWNQRVTAMKKVLLSI